MLTPTGYPPPTQQPPGPTAHTAHSQQPALCGARRPHRSTPPPPAVARLLRPLSKQGKGAKLKSETAARRSSSGETRTTRRPRMPGAQRAPPPGQKRGRNLYAPMRSTALTAPTTPTDFASGGELPLSRTAVFLAVPKRSPIVAPPPRANTTPSDRRAAASREHGANPHLFITQAFGVSTRTSARGLVRAAALRRRSTGTTETTTRPPRRCPPSRFMTLRALAPRPRLFRLCGNRRGGTLQCAPTQLTARRSASQLGTELRLGRTAHWSPPRTCPMVSTS